MAKKRLKNSLNKEVTVGKVNAISVIVCCSVLFSMVMYFISKRASGKFVEVNTQDIWEELKKSTSSPEDLEKRRDKLNRRIYTIRQRLESKVTRKAQDEDLQKEDKK